MHTLIWGTQSIFIFIKRKRKVPDFRMKQCLFGEHLLSDNSAAMSAKPVAIAESEKTALVAFHFITDFIWLATREMHGCFNSEAMQVLDSREVILFPDLKATEEWKRRLPILESVCRHTTRSNLLERMATDGQRSQRLDIADFLLMKDTPQMILARMVERNPVLQTFIDTSGLNWWMRRRRNDGKVSNSSLSYEKGVVKSRLLGHFHSLRSASGSQKKHRPREYLKFQT